MIIRNRAELRQAVEKAGELLQEIQNYCEANDLNWMEVEEARVRFPRGWIRTANEQRKRLPFVRDRHLKDNIAYTLILSDVLLWLSLRTDLWGTASEMITKHYIALIASLCESLTKDYLKGVCGKSYKTRSEYLFKTGVISEELRDDLNWLWDVRQNIHLFMLDRPEYVNDYTVENRRRCVMTFRKLLIALRVDYGRRARQPPLPKRSGTG